VNLRKLEICALDRLLFEHSQRSARAESLFAAVLTVYSQGSENLSETVDNTGTNKCLW
jgi:hypothetical protein